MTSHENMIMLDYIPTAKLTGGLLAGGMGRRMNGMDKGLQPFRGEIMATHVLKALKSVSAQQVISANRNLDKYAKLGSTVVCDRELPQCGPLGGIYHLLKACDTPYLITAPCDSPLVSSELLHHLLALPASDTSLRCLHDGDRLQPLFMLIGIALTPMLRNYLAEGGRRVQEWLLLHQCEIIHAPAMKAQFQNFNTLQELAAGSGDEAPDQ